MLWDQRRSARRRLLRTSDVDREQVVEQLRVAAGEGRLTIDELGERIEQAYSSRTFADLDPITADLPEGSTVDSGRMEMISPGEGAALPRFRLTYRRPLADVAIQWAALSLVCAAGFFLSGAHGTFWPVYVILFGAFRVTMVALHRREQRHRSELRAQQMGQIGSASGLWGLFGPRGPFGRRGPFGTGGS